jgi:glycosyltransferase involved in cell wall biosynthesis/MoaA/NifB/PqqE/SkfB family radical SAM enzyme
MRYNAGSEVYTQTLCHGLAERHDVHVFTREEDPFAVDYALRTEVDPDDSRVVLHVINLPRSRDRYRHAGVDQRLADVLDAFRPDIVHVGHLNHLSTSLVFEAANREIPVVYTLHDYWLMCPRGQFMQMHPADPNDLWAACDGQQDRECALRCYARYFSGAVDEEQRDIDYWQDWVARRMKHARALAEVVDVFLAPAQYLLNRYRDGFGLPERKLLFLDYGFDLKRLQGRERVSGEPFTFGYIGTHIPAKGIHQLLDAFGALRGNARLRIWGRPRGQDTDALKAFASRLPRDAGTRVEWTDEYKNQAIVRDVFNHVDAIVVPSVWVENSPLVIHEALQARVPVITANTGGMAEYVRHEENGLLFEHRNVAALATQMQRLVDEPDLAVRLGRRGYVQSATGDVPDIASHVEEIENTYRRVLARRDSARLAPTTGPWRITFDTNPDTCNLHCVMCEGHSLQAPHNAPVARANGDSRAPRLMPVELIRNVVADAASHGLREIIPSTMGEPLLYEGFDEILALCERHNVKLNLTTNGTFPGRGARAWAERIVPLASDVKISWNGATAATQERIMVGSHWQRALENVRTFIAVRDAVAANGGPRCRVTFQLTFLEANVAELADIVRLAISLGVDRVKGHHVWTHFDSLQAMSMRRSPEAIRRWNQAVRAARAAAAERTLPNGAHILLENIFLLDESAVDDLAPGGPCPFLGREAWVSAEGRFSPCCAPDELRRTLGNYGDVNESPLLDIWNGEAYQGLVRTYRNRDLCVRCNMRAPVEAP